MSEPVGMREVVVIMRAGEGAIIWGRGLRCGDWPAGMGNIALLLVVSI